MYGMTVNERVDLLITMLGLRQEQFSEDVKEDDGYISEIVEEKGNVTEELTAKISERYGINEEWLRNGTGRVFKGKRLNNGKELFTDYYGDIEWDYRLEAKQLMKALTVLDVIREGEPLFIKDALAILDTAKDILLAYKPV